MVYKKREGSPSRSKSSSKTGKFDKKGSSRSDRSSSDSRSARSDRSSSDSRTPRSDRFSTDSRAPRSDRSSSDSRTPRSDSRTPRSDSRTPRSDSRTPRLDSRTPRLDSRTPRSDSRTPRSDSRTPRSDSRTPRSDRFSTDSRAPRSEKRDYPSTDHNRIANERPQKLERKDFSSPLRTKKGMPKEIFIWGRRTVEAFLENLHQQSKDIDSSKYGLHIIVDKSHKAPSQLKPSVESAKLLGIKIVPHDSAEETWPLADASEELNHQRICLKIPEYPVQNIVEAINHVKAANENSEHGCVGIVLDQIQDPRNFGAIIRSAAFFGVKFVVYGTDRQADISSLVLKTSAGGAFSISLIPAVNINRTLQQLKEAGAWIAGAALAESAVALNTVPKDRAWVAVMGNEGKGLRNEVLKNCDYVVQIPGGQGTVDSLNVSVAAGIMIHALSK